MYGTADFWGSLYKWPERSFLALMIPTTKKQVATTDIKTLASTLPQ